LSTVATNQIELALVGDTVAITLRAGDIDCIRTRHVTLESAIDLSLLLDGGAFHWALNYAVNPGVTLQILNLPYEEAWICISDDSVDGGASLNACVEGEAVADIGRRFNDLVVAAKGKSRKAKRAIHIRQVGRCYLDQEGGD
jgi:hypothetical protein